MSCQEWHDLPDIDGYEHWCHLLVIKRVRGGSCRPRRCTPNISRYQIALNCFKRNTRRQQNGNMCQIAVVLFVNVRLAVTNVLQIVHTGITFPTNWTDAASLLVQALKFAQNDTRWRFAVEILVYSKPIYLSTAN